MTSRIFALLVLFSIFLAVTAAAQEIVRFEDGWGDPGFTLVSQSPREVELLFSVPYIELREIEADGERMTKVVLPGAHLGNDAGAPDLPGVSRFIAVPQGAFVKMEVLASRSRVFEDMDIAPAPPIPRETDDSGPVYKKDPAIYDADQDYPVQPVLLSPPCRLRGVDAALIGVTPFSYNPITRQLIVYTDLSIRITFLGGNGTFGEDRLRSRWFEPLLEQHLINFDSLRPVNFSSKPPARDPDECEYMIFVPDDPDFIAWADVIKDFRVKQGITTNVFNIADLGGTANDIENKINYAYNNWAAPPVAVLMLGDLPDMPVKIWSSYCLSDNIYADVDGDDLPDLTLARITARNNADLDRLVNKFINYETNPPTAINFYNEPIMAGGWQTERWFILCTEVVFGFMTNSEGKSPKREYAIYSGSPGSVWSTATNTSTVVSYFGPSGLGYIPSTPSHLTDWGGNATRINSDINSGAFYMLHRDHGYELGWGEPDYDLYDLPGLTNDDLTFVMSINCLTGKYDYSPESFTEVFHRMDHGALGLIAASEISYSFVNDTFVWGMHDSMWPHFDPGYGGSTGDHVLMPGFAQASGKWYLAASSWPYNSGSKDVTYHLFHMHGDAFTQVYSEVPQSLTVSHADTIDAAAVTFDVSADVDSLIALSFEGRVLGTATGTGSSTAVSIDPPGVEGIMYVTVTKPNHFRYEGQVNVVLSGPPVVEDVTPCDGGIAGGTTCTISGQNFTSTPDTTVTFGSDPAGRVAVVDPNTITCDSPAHAAGAVDVTVTNSNGSDTLSGGFCYHNAPSLSTISPDNGPPSGGTAVTITGSDFTTVGTTTVTIGGSSATSIVLLNTTTITCTTPAQGRGTVDVVVTTDFGTDTLSNGYTYNAPPTISSVTPTDGPVAGGTAVTISGTAFTPTPDMTVSFGGTAATGIVVVDSTTITCNTPAHAAGAVDVTVSNINGSDTLTGGFTYHNAPGLTSISPDNGPQTGGTAVTLTGSDFTTVGTTTVTFDGTGATSIVVVNTTTITCTTPAHSPATVNVVVTNDFGTDTLTNGYTYNNPPTVSSVTPTDGPVAGGTAVTIAGAGFTTTPDTSVSFGGTAATGVVVVNSTTITCNTPAHAAGAVDVTVTNSNGSDTLPNAFTYHNPPSLALVSPDNGPPTGGTAVTLTGNDFTGVGVTTVTFGGTSATSVVVVNTTTITCTTPAHSSGAVDVVVTNDFGTDTLTNGYTYNNPPTVSSVTPADGPVAGGTAVTISGADFTTTPDTSVSFGGTAATSIVVVNSTTITCTTPAHAAGAVDVTVTNSNGSDTLPGGFTYHNAPSLASVSPDNGPQTGGTAVTLTGSDFTGVGVTTVTFGGLSATGVVVVNTTTITCTTPAHSPGIVDVVVTNDFGTDTLNNGYTYNNPPTVSSVTPADGSVAGGTAVTIAGAGFTTTPDTTVSFGGTAATSVVVVNASTITCNTPAHVAGAVDVTVTNSNGSDTLPNAFTYHNPPSLALVSPDNGSPAGGTAVTLTGNDFTGIGVTTVTFGGVSATSIVVVNTTTITCTTPAHSPGVVDVVVTNDFGTDTLNNGYTYNNPPTVSSVTPTDGPVAGGTAVTISGAGFTTSPDTTVTFGGTAATGVMVLNSTTITCTTPAHAAGAVGVTVTNSNGSDTLPNAFTYHNPPSLASVSPDNGPPSGGTAVTLTGSDFTGVGSTTVTFDGVSATGVVVVNTTTITCTTPAHSPGSVDVVVTNDFGSDTLPGGYTYNNAPSIASVTPGDGGIAGGTAVTITGTGFTTTPDTTVTFGGTSATSVIVVDATTITCTTPAHAAGAVDVTVTNSNGSDTLPNGFTYHNPPDLVSISPRVGPLEGGTTVTLEGSDFTNIGVTTVTFGGSSATNVVVENTTTITCTTPAHSQGSVDVVVANDFGSDTLIKGFTYFDDPVVTSVTPPFGNMAGGATVTIEGDNFTFSSDMKVFFDALKATDVVVIDQNTLTCTTPASPIPDKVDVMVITSIGSGTLINGFIFFPPGGAPAQNLTDVDTLDLYPHDVVKHATIGPPGALYMVFLSFGPGPTNSPWGPAGLDMPIYFLWSGVLNSTGYQTVTLVMPDAGAGFINFYTHALVDESPPVWAEGGNNPNGTGSIMWGLN
ncbi:MAG: IPT/TIG domain-containing protein [Planctomycetota bacterium]